MEKAVPEFLYHYTSINTLGLILKNKTIRFNNLTAMDDLDEADFGGKNWGKYYFISSWTNEVEESIPMWNMYSNNMGGVRIKMPIYPFKEYMTQWGNCLIPESEIEGYQYAVTSHRQDKQFLFPVKYDDIEYTKAMKNHNPMTINDTGLTFNGKGLGLWKNSYWSFQKEWRYMLTIFPLGMKNMRDNKSLFERQKQNFVALVDLPFSDYYLNLREDALQKMEITLGPKTNEIDVEFVQMLVDKYNPHAKILRSALTGKIK